MLDNVPPPPKSQPPKIEELTVALEKQLSEIEKQVVEKRKQASNSPQEKVKIATPSFGNSMREMLKNVVSSQKNVKTKKVENIEKTSGKMGKFFQNLTSSKNSLSKSNQSLAQSKDSLDQVQAPKEVKKRSKSLSTETRNRSDLGTSSVSKGTRAENLGQQKGGSRWLGKNPFEQSTNSSEVVSNKNPFMNEETDLEISGPEKRSRPLVRSRSSCSQRDLKKEGSTLGTEKVNISLLIQECEDYVKTEEFTKDLSSEILKMFMQERNSARDSFYDNLTKEESPDSNDSAYDSDKKAELFDKSSSLMMDNISNASTIKNQLLREESISYDTVLR